MENLRVVVKDTKFRNPDNGYAVIRAIVDGRKDTITVVGNLGIIEVGASLLLTGEWEINRHFGQQFKVAVSQVVMPNTKEGIKRLLSGSLIRGIGKKLAGIIVDKFGLETIDIIENHPEELEVIPKIGKKRIRILHDNWMRGREAYNVMIFLQSHNVSVAYATKIFKKYGNNSIRLIQENPYRLADEIWGIGFLTADRIASSLGFRNEHPFRCRSGILYALSKESDAGHTFCYYQEVLDKASEILDVKEEFVKTALNNLISHKYVYEDNGRIYLPDLYWAEVNVANRLCALTHESIHCGISVEEAYHIGKSIGFDYDTLQAKAVSEASSNGVMVLTGGPGTGKTTTIQGILRVFQNMGKQILLAAPTGRAAKRMSEMCGEEARTIHRLLEYTPGEGFKRNDSNPLDGDVLIVDECSMIDIRLMEALVMAIPNGMNVVFVGDIDQLPSVGPGNVLKDIIASDVCSVIRLTHIFRQALSSNIVYNAHQINKGLRPKKDNSKDSDFMLITQGEGGDASVVANYVIDLVSRRLPAYYGVSPFNIQVLAPMRKGVVGTTALNALLQEAINPGEGGILRQGVHYRVGDKVMQLRNNYDKEVFNGDIGVIIDTDDEERVATVRFDDEKDVVYESSELDEFTLAYATTVHKSQGSEYPIVVMPLLTNHYMMLQRNLVYTAITRAKQLFVLITSGKALAMAIRNDKVQERNTFLTERIKEKFTMYKAS